MPSDPEELAEDFEELCDGLITLFTNSGAEQDLAQQISELIQKLKARMLFGPVSSLPSAASIDLGLAATHLIEITGNTGPITSFGSSASLDTPIYVIRFASNPTITHNGVSMKMPGGVNYN